MVFIRNISVHLRIQMSLVAQKVLVEPAFPEVRNWRGAEIGLVLNTKYRLYYRKPDRQTKRRTCVTQQHGEFAND